MDSAVPVSSSMQISLPAIVGLTIMSFECFPCILLMFMCRIWSSKSDTSNSWIVCTSLSILQCTPVFPETGPFNMCCIGTKMTHSVDMPTFIRFVVTPHWKQGLVGAVLYINILFGVGAFMWILLTVRWFCCPSNSITSLVKVSIATAVFTALSRARSSFDRRFFWMFSLRRPHTNLSRSESSR